MQGRGNARPCFICWGMGVGGIVLVGIEVRDLAVICS